MPSLLWLARCFSAAIYNRSPFVYLYIWIYGVWLCNIEWIMICNIRNCTWVRYYDGNNKTIIKHLYLYNIIVYVLYLSKCGCVCKTAPPCQLNGIRSPAIDDAVVAMAWTGGRGGGLRCTPFFLFWNKKKKKRTERQSNKQNLNVIYLSCTRESVPMANRLCEIREWGVRACASSFIFRLNIEMPVAHNDPGTCYFNMCVRVSLLAGWREPTNTCSPEKKLGYLAFLFHYARSLLLLFCSDTIFFLLLSCSIDFEYISSGWYALHVARDQMRSMERRWYSLVVCNEYVGRQERHCGSFHSGRLHIGGAGFCCCCCWDIAPPCFVNTERWRASHIWLVQGQYRVLLDHF